MPADSVAVVICAAGSSARFRAGTSGDGNAKKEYRILPGNAAGLTVLGAAVSAFAAVPEVGAIVVAVPDDPETGEAAARKALPPELLARVRFVSGGKTRRASVHRALSLLAGDWPAGTFALALIHDGARPRIDGSLIDRVIRETKKHRAAVPLVPLTETPKETDAPPGSGTVFIRRHPRRALVSGAQTPQGFAFPEILGAHEKAAGAEAAGAEFTDDAEVWAAFCGPVAAVPGDPENRKITFPGDLYREGIFY